MTEETVIIPTGAGAAESQRPAGSPRQPPPPAPPPPPPPSPTPVNPGPKRARRSPTGAVVLIAAAFVLTGLATGLVTIYALSPRDAPVVIAGSDTIPAAKDDVAPGEAKGNADGEAGGESGGADGDETVDEADLDAEIAPVEGEGSEEADLALIESVVSPAIVELSGDPVVVKVEPGRERQLVRVTGDAKREAAAAALGARGAVFRLSDMLDGQDRSLANGVLGAQQDFALFQTTTAASDAVESAPDDPQSAAERGSTTLPVADSGVSRQQFARRIEAPTSLAAVLASFGLDGGSVTAAAKSFQDLYGIKDLKAKDEIAVMAAKLPDADGLAPVQVSLYRGDAWLGTIAMLESGGFAMGEDPWYQKNIFEAELLPEATPRTDVRLMEAIYAAALRNGLPAPVAGETIMMLSRTFDLEQNVEPGDSIAILFADAARDPALGMGRVIFVRIARSSGALECYVSQPAPGQPFECLTGQGQPSFDGAGLVMPVNGTVVAKFGPQEKSAGGEAGAMNYGVDWAAPAGSPVVAATAGKVTSAGQEQGKGNVLRIGGDDGSEASYAYLQKFAAGIAAGAVVTAGQQIGFVGLPPDSREPRLHFELRRNGQPVDPVAEMQDNTMKGSPVDVFVSRIIQIESANRCDARNPLSTAVGLGQFIESTWMTTIRLHRPDLLKGRSRGEVLTLRTNCELARAMTSAFTRDNAAVIRSRGHGVTPGNLYLAHFLGVGGALRALQPDNHGRMISEVFGQKHVDANPFERGKTVGYLVSWAAKKMGRPGGRESAAAVASPPKGYASREQRTPGPPASSAARERQTAAAGSSPEATTAGKAPAGAPVDAGAPLAREPDDPRFAELRRNVDILMR